ncbi:hypothetical protein AAFC00_000524 [Neodothiora populina]|uniref:Heme haloperoxidase family profile domain-containing protein n=1 Tax=Neodothiora populina TaxID=2781224 RepID=A0ABR3PD81_9PEZI
MKCQILFTALPSLALAFPGMLPGASKEEMLNAMKARSESEKLQDRDLISDLSGVVANTVSSLVSDVEGLIQSLASGVDPNDKRPQEGYEFQEPGSGDSRGPCPGLNLLANYGYLPRNGHVSLSQVVAATAEGFNMGTDLSTLLAVFAVLTDGDLATESWYLGGDPSGAGGLNRHSTVEADVSPNREDFYNGCGDNHHLSSRIFKQNVGFASQSANKDFGLDTMAKHYAANAAFSKEYNPWIYYFPFPSIVSFAAYAFYPNFFSNGTYGSGGVANYESISSIIGAKLNEKTGNFEYVPERWPENWYRRSYEYDAVTALTQGLAIYLTNPIGMPFGQLGTANLNLTTVLCDIYQGINSIVPLFITGGEEDVAAAVTWVASKLEPTLTGTLLGCPLNALSANSDFSLFPNSNTEGGPLNRPPSVEANTGDNVYSKVYFTATPTSPLCSHVATA